ncbi:iron complex transport system substrate-binding protein [Lentibacillus halodurans]|uniref:Iron complex transport system substrate-binding protein n=1 Tax=Lentibacillus halodurans TaxID=237679 RepID=A0A1I0YRX2_9BACI|nr:iron-siderophore ABC transporter substrate-binding protein [Lentibacillus halodurans]SFB15190.1 iron complex transport system substrate-binding protein [Lentibacillus halodurans]
MRNWLLLISILVLTMLAACGSNGGETDSDSNDAEHTDAHTVTIEDATGEKTIEGIPEDIVALEWYNAEQLLSLGIQPAGIPNVEGFNDWMNIEEELAESVEDVGTREEPNLEAIKRMEPDLIIAAQFRHEQILDRLEDIAPVVTFAPYSEEGSADLYESLMSEYETIAEITDKEQEADQAIADLNDFYDEQRQRLADAGLEGTKYIATMAFSSQNSPVLRLYSDNSYPAAVMENLGFENAYQTDDAEQYGFTEVGIETLQYFQEDDLQFFSIVQENDHIFEDQLAGNAVWENLSFVKEGNTHYLPGDTPVIGGVSSAKALTEQIVDTMLDE